MRNAMELSQPTCGRQGLLLKDPIYKSLKHPGLVGFECNKLHQLQRGAKLNLFCWDRESWTTQDFPLHTL